MPWKLFYPLNEADSAIVPDTTQDLGTAGKHLTLVKDATNMVFMSNGQGRGLNWAAAPLTTAARAGATLGSTLAAELNGVTQGTFIFKRSALTSDDWSTVFRLGAQTAPRAMEYELSAIGLHMFRFQECAFPFYNSTDYTAVVINSTAVDIADRVKIRGWNGSLAAITPDGGYGAITFPQNTALTGLVDTSDIVIGNRANQSVNATGAIKCVGWHTAALTDAELTTAFTALDTTDDAAPNLTPVLTLTAPLTLDQVVATSLRANVTTSVNATVDYVVGAAASAQPSEPTFDASTIGGSSTAFTPFQTTIPALTPGASIRVHVRVTDGTTTLYDYEDVTLPAVSNVILSVNGGTPIRYDQTSFDITWDTAPGSLSAVTLNGVAQGAHTSINATTTRVARTSANWPATRYNTNIPLVTGAASGTTSMIPATGYSVRRLGAGFVENPPQTLDSNGNAVPGDEEVINTQGGAVSMDDLGRLTFNAGFNGLVEWAIVDQADGAHSAFAFYPYSAGADILPTVPTFPANVTGANPGQAVRFSYVLAGVTPATDIPVVAAGFLQVSTTDGSGYGPSITRQLGQTIYCEIIAGAFGEVRTGNVSMNGVTAVAPLSVTTRAANAPAITSPISGPASVTVGAPANFTAGLTGMAAIQWRVNGVNHPGANAIPFVYTPPAVGTYSIDYVATGPEGGTVTGTAVSLSVIAVANRVLLPELRSRVTNLLRGGEQNVACYVVSDNRAQVLIPATTINLASSGTTPLVNNLLGVIGTWVRVGFPESDGTAVEVRLQVEA
ncbi:MAG: hypothetical protein HPY82_05690 [Gammaproteobacteria bacterium]|nr:hypothetical protein [Gammaproteobacteria bacterium]